MRLHTAVYVSSYCYVCFLILLFMCPDRYGKTKWVMDDAKEVEELIACVREQMVPVSDVELHAKLFNKDFKKQVRGI